MDILILGNGFDLAHGLKTKYCDFLNYCRNDDKYKDFCSSNLWMKHFLNKTIIGNNWIDLENEIFNVIVKLSTLPYFRNNVSYEKDKETLFLISKYYLDFNFDEVGKYFRKQESLFHNDCYYVKIKDFIPFLFNQLRDFVKEFENYLTAEQEKVINEPKYSLRLNQNCVSLLNFNYTDTCEQLYKIKFDSNNCGIKTKAVYVHGKVNAKDCCNLVLGTHSFNNEQIPVGFNIFKKHNQRHKYNTIEEYQSLLHIIKNPKDNTKFVFHVIGHSLDKSDAVILKHIFLANKNAIINIYYHDEISQEKLINNITEIIGEDEVMAKVRMIYQHDPKRGILIPAKKLLLSED